MRIGPYELTNNVALAPMAGVTDRPFRQLCRRLGAGLAVCEMVSANPSLRGTAKSRLRIDHAGEPEPVSVQIAGADPALMAEAARFNVDQGAQIIDINMGCPAKKVCNLMAGSALLKDEVLVGRILDAVVGAVDVPVTLKMRTGWASTHRNGARIEAAGIQALSIHGRTRADGYRGEAEYDTIRRVKSQVVIPVLANGDIDSPQKARYVLDQTGADGVMIGRAAQGRPWLPGQVARYLASGVLRPSPTLLEVRDLLGEHLEALYGFYGEHQGVRIARKHIKWHCAAHPESAPFWRAVSEVECAREQARMTHRHFTHLAVCQPNRLAA
jgi:tRNA-dihydrouridine synthase B